MQLLPSSFPNHTHLIKAHLSDGGTQQCVVRRYQIFGKSDRGEKARREFKAFEMIHDHGSPGPEPLLLDETSELLCGHMAENLAFCKMAAAVRPTLDPEAWQMDREMIAGRLQQFMEEEIKRN